MKLFKSRKTYYLYNPNTLNYERVYPSSKDRLFTVLRHLSTGIAFGVATFFVMMHLVDSPMESQLRKENRLLQTQYEVLSLRLNNALDVLVDIHSVTRICTGRSSKPSPSRVRSEAGFGGTNRYEHLMSLSNPELVVSTTQKMDMLRKQLYIQSNSLEELISLGKNQEERSKCIPAIQPISNKDRVVPLPAMAYVSTRFTVHLVSIPEWISRQKWERRSMRQVMALSLSPLGNRDTEIV